MGKQVSRLWEAPSSVNVRRFAVDESLSEMSGPCTRSASATLGTTYFRRKFFSITSRAPASAVSVRWNLTHREMAWHGFRDKQLIGDS